MTVFLRSHADKKASCKWRYAQRAMRNMKFIGYTLEPLERDHQGIKCFNGC